MGFSYWRPRRDGWEKPGLSFVTGTQFFSLAYKHHYPKDGARGRTPAPAVFSHSALWVPPIRSLDSNLTFSFAGSHCLSSECRAVTFQPARESWAFSWVGAWHTQRTPCHMASCKLLRFQSVFSGHALPEGDCTFVFQRCTSHRYWNCQTALATSCTRMLGGQWPLARHHSEVSLWQQKPIKVCLVSSV